MGTALYLCALEHTSDFIYYCLPNRNGEQSINAGENALCIKSLKFEASVFSPPILKATCYIDNYPVEKIVPYHTIYTVIACDTSQEAIDSPWAACLFTNDENLIPFTAVDVSCLDNQTILVTLMEERSLSLALVHSFACIGQESIGSGEQEDGLLSIAKIVEKLSDVPEYEKEKSSETLRIKNIFNFNAYSLDSKQNVISKNNNKLFNYAFLSRFIVPASQSRLEAITSLMFKFGYGFAFRPLDRQYYAVDLLSNSAPGYKTNSAMLCVNGFTDKRYIFEDRWQTEEYFKVYAKKYYKDNLAHFSSKLQKFEVKKREYEDGEVFHYFSHDFADFYCNRLFDYSFRTDCTAHHLSTSSVCNYYYLPYYSNVAYSRNRNNGKKFNTGCQEGTSKLFIEDQIEPKEFPNKEILETRNYSDTIKAVNSRLAYAKYKLDFMQQNSFTQNFKFETGIGLSSSFNLVYEIFNWLGFHTDIFMRLSSSSKLAVKKKNIPSHSGATHSIDATKTPDFWKNNENLTDFIQKFSDYIPLLPQYSDKWALFGKFSISIEEAMLKGYDTFLKFKYDKPDSGNDGKEKSMYEYNSYVITSALTFYFDVTDYNTGIPFKSCEDKHIVFDTDNTGEFKRLIKDIDNLSDILSSEKDNNDNKDDKDAVSGIIPYTMNSWLMNAGQNINNNNNVDRNIIHYKPCSVTGNDRNTAESILEKENILDTSEGERLRKDILESRMEFLDDSAPYCNADNEVCLKAFVAYKWQKRINEDKRRKAQREGLSHYKKVEIRYPFIDNDIIDHELDRMNDKDKVFVGLLRAQCEGWEMDSPEVIDN